VRPGRESFLKGAIVRAIWCGVRFITGRRLFAALWSFIGCVSVFDSWLVVRFRDVIQQVEENPVGSYLIDLNNGHPEVFLWTKAAGTVLVLSVLAGLYKYRRGWAFPVTACVAIFQCGLLVYLMAGRSTRVENMIEARRARQVSGYSVWQSHRLGTDGSVLALGPRQ
jgi:hypothetical protein